MANKVRDYQKLATDIKDTIGSENIVTATHCATRLRLVLKKMPDDSATKEIEQMSGVIQVVASGGQYQIVIGPHAKDVYEYLSGMVNFSEEAPGQQGNCRNVRLYCAICLRHGSSGVIAGDFNHY